MAIRTKLALWYSLLIAAILILLAGPRYLGQKRVLMEQKDDSLRVLAGVLESAIPTGQVSPDRFQTAMARMVQDYPEIELKGILIEVYDPSPHLVFSSSLSEREKLPINPEIWDRAAQGETSILTLSLPANNEPVRVLSKPVFDGPELTYLIQAGSTLQDVQAHLESFLLFNAFLIPIAAVLAGFGGWFITRQALKPLDKIVQTAYQIGSSDLSHRIDLPESGKEIRELVHAFNHMISRLESSFSQIREFSDNVSHELRIPLAILRGQTELSLRRHRSPDEYRKVLQSNLEEVLRMERVVDRLLFLSRADSGEIRLDISCFDLSDLLQEVHSQFLHAAQEKGIHLTLQSQEPVWIYGDALLLREVLLNLTQNAVTYTDSGGEIRLEIRKTPAAVVIGVSDTGVGIPEDDLPYIFNRFYKVDKSRSSQGHGLGLSICKWIVEAHQGSIQVDSRPGQGSRFTIHLPNSRLAPPPAGAPPG